jgi:HSF-type DNA-binding
MDVLMNEEHHGIISFLEHGNGFVIHKKRVFAAEVLPKYFKASKVGPHESC